MVLCGTVKTKKEVITEHSAISSGPLNESKIYLWAKSYELLRLK